MWWLAQVGARSLLCAGLVLTPSDIRWRPDRSSTVASLRCHPCTGQYLAPRWTSAWLFLSSYDRGCCSGHPCTDISHTCLECLERFLLVVFAGSEGTCICVCIHISKLTFKHCLAFTSFFNIYLSIWLCQIFFAVCGLLSSCGIGA